MLGGTLAAGLILVIVVALVLDSRRPIPSITYINGDGEEVTMLIGSVRHTDSESIARRITRINNGSTRCRS